MAPAQSKLSQSEISGPRKRKASSKITDENFVGAESNAVTKRLKLSAKAARAASTKQSQRQASVEDVEDQNDIPRNIPPKNPNTLLEAADGSDDEVEELDNDPAPPLENVEPDEDDDDEDDDEEVEITEPVETAEAQIGESNKML